MVRFHARAASFNTKRVTLSIVAVACCLWLRYSTRRTCCSRHHGGNGESVCLQRPKRCIAAFRRHYVYNIATKLSHMRPRRFSMSAFPPLQAAVAVLLLALCSAQPGGQSVRIATQN